MTAHDARPQSAGQDSTMSTSPRSTTRAADLQPEDVAEDGADSDTESFKDAVEGEAWESLLACAKDSGMLKNLLHACVHTTIS